MKVSGPALALLEIESIARGMVVADALVKRAPVELALAEPVSPGKYLLLFSGGVAETEEAFKAGIEAAGSTLLDKLFLSRPAPRLLEALKDKFDETWGDSFAIVETHSAASTLRAADSALKRAEVWVRRLHLARGIGGKGYFVLTRALDMIEAAVEASAAAIEPQLLGAAEVTPRPPPDIQRWAVQRRTLDLGMASGESDYWGRGYGSESPGLILDYGFKTHGLHTITLKVFSSNSAAIRAYEKAGFRRMGERREGHRANGEIWNILFMDCLFSDRELAADGQHSQSRRG